MSSTGPQVKALLVSDLVGSTQLVELLGDSPSADLFERHDRLARDLMVEHGGVEIDKTDGFLLLFDAPCRLSNMPWRTSGDCSA
jgi:class 3 adenylate cyclase